MSVADGVWSSQSLLRLTLSAVAFLGVGLTGLVGGSAVKISSTVKEHRLEKIGEPVSAQLSDYRSGHKGASASVWVSYNFDGQAYRTFTDCRPDNLCNPAKTTTLALKVDPDQPDEFVTAAGSTDDSRNWLNSWKAIVLGAVLTVFGGLLVAARIYMMLMERRELRGAKPGNADERATRPVEGRVATG